jgi:hypothetical protein
VILPLFVVVSFFDVNKFSSSLFDSLEAMGVKETDLPDRLNIRLQESFDRFRNDPLFEANSQQK